MNISPITPFPYLLNQSKFSRPLDRHGSLRRTSSDEHLKAHWLQRWENEGGRIAPQPQPHHER